MTLKVERMSLNDVPQSLKIENECFPIPNTSDDFLKFSKEGLSFVAKKDAAVVGYVVSETVLDECHVVRIAVDPRHRRRGVGRKLMMGLFNEGGKAGIKKFYLEVRISNKSSIDFYKKAGFKQVRVRKEYYADNGEDAVLMERLS